MPHRGVIQGSRFGVQPSGCTDSEQAKACTPCRVRSSAQDFRVWSSAFGCTDLEQAKACTPCRVRSSAQSSGLEFSLQAALTLSRLKPVRSEERRVGKECSGRRGDG